MYFGHGLYESHHDVHCLLVFDISGAVGGVCALANVLGKDCCDLHELYHAGKYETHHDVQTFTCF